MKSLLTVLAYRLPSHPVRCRRRKEKERARHITSNSRCPSVPSCPSFPLHAAPLLLPSQPKPAQANPHLPTPHCGTSLLAHRVHSTTSIFSFVLDQVSPYLCCRLPILAILHRIEAQTLRQPCCIRARPSSFPLPSAIASLLLPAQPAQPASTGDSDTPNPYPRPTGAVLSTALLLCLPVTGRWSWLVSVGPSIHPPTSHTPLLCLVRAAGTHERPSQARSNIFPARQAPQPRLFSLVDSAPTPRQRPSRPTSSNHRLRSVQAAALILLSSPARARPLHFPEGQYSKAVKVLAACLGHRISRCLCWLLGVPPGRCHLRLTVDLLLRSNIPPPTSNSLGPPLWSQAEYYRSILVHPNRRRPIFGLTLQPRLEAPSRGGNTRAVAAEEDPADRDRGLVPGGCLLVHTPWSLLSQPARRWVQSCQAPSITQSHTRTHARARARARPDTTHLIHPYFATSTLPADTLLDIPTCKVPASTIALTRSYCRLARQSRPGGL